MAALTQTWSFSIARSTFLLFGVEGNLQEDAWDICDENYTVPTTWSRDYARYPFLSLWGKYEVRRGCRRRRKYILCNLVSYCKCEYRRRIILEEIRRWRCTYLFNDRRKMRFGLTKQQYDQRRGSPGSKYKLDTRLNTEKPTRIAIADPRRKCGP